MSKIDASSLNLEEKVISIKRCAKVVKGGRRFSFSSLCVVGDRQGHVGVGSGKASEIPSAIRKAIEKAKKNLIYIDITSPTIPFPISAKSGASYVIMKPARRGRGIVAGGPVRAILELVGIKDVLTKSIGSSSPANVAAATLKCLQEIKKSYDIRKYRIGENSLHPTLSEKTSSENSQEKVQTTS